MRKFYLNCIFILCAISVLANQKDNSPPPIESYKLDQPLIVDGFLNESLYQQIPISNFVKKEPVEGGPASEKTHVWISYDESNIYFSGRFFDSEPDSIDRSLMRRDNMTESDFSVEKFGRQIGMSRAQLHRKLRALTDASPSQFIRILRLKRAAQLLQQDSGNVAEIAYEVGFNNPSYFAECFQKQFGLVLVGERAVGEASGEV